METAHGENAAKFKTRLSNSATVSDTGQADIGQRLTFKIDPNLIELKKTQTKKLSRNESEKLRRDRLNFYIGELAKMVPLILESDKKIDKASVLRLTATYFKVYYVLMKGLRRNCSDSSWSPDLNMFDKFGIHFLSAIRGFLLVVDKKGILIFASSTLIKFLGHRLSDLLGCSINGIIHSNDIAVLRQQFQWTNRDRHYDDLSPDRNLNGSSAPIEAQRSFYLRMLNVLDQQSTHYDIVHVTGCLQSLGVVEPKNIRLDHNGGVHKNGDAQETCLIGVARLISYEPISEIYPSVENCPNQWITQHDMDGKITFSDQRGAILTGFMPGESIGISPYSLIHEDDISDVVYLHNRYLETRDLPFTVFRMYTKSREIIFIQNNTHMIVDDWTRKPKCILNINELLSETKGKAAIIEQNRRINMIESDRALRSSSDCMNMTTSTSELDSLTASFDVDTSSCSSSSIVPFVENVDDQTVNVIVGLHKFHIDLKQSAKYPDSPDVSETIDQSNVDAIINAGAKNTGGVIPSVMPVFLGDVTDDLTSSPLVSESCRNSVSLCATKTAAALYKLEKETKNHNGSIVKTVRQPKIVETDSMKICGQNHRLSDQSSLPASVMAGNGLNGGAVNIHVTAPAGSDNNVMLRRLLSAGLAASLRRQTVCEEARDITTGAGVMYSLPEMSTGGDSEAVLLKSPAITTDWSQSFYHPSTTSSGPFLETCPKISTSTYRTTGPKVKTTSGLGKRLYSQTSPASPLSSSSSSCMSAAPFLFNDNHDDDEDIMSNCTKKSTRCNGNGLLSTNMPLKSPTGCSQNAAHMFQLIQANGVDKKNVRSHPAMLHNNAATGADNQHSCFANVAETAASYDSPIEAVPSLRLSHNVGLQSSMISPIKTSSVRSSAETGFVRSPIETSFVYSLVDTGSERSPVEKRLPPQYHAGNGYAPIVSRDNTKNDCMFGDPSTSESESHNHAAVGSFFVSIGHVSDNLDLFADIDANSCDGLVDLIPSKANEIDMVQWEFFRDDNL